MPGPTPEELKDVKYWLDEASEAELEKLRHHGLQMQGNASAFCKIIDEVKARKIRRDRKQSLQSNGGV